MIFRDHEADITRMARVRTKTSSPDKGEAGMDSASISRDHEARIALWVKVRIRTFKGGKIENPADLTEISRAEDRADTAKVSKVEVKDHAVRALDVGT